MAVGFGADDVNVFLSHVHLNVLPESIISELHSTSICTISCYYYKSLLILNTCSSNVLNRRHDTLISTHILVLLPPQT